MARRYIQIGQQKRCFPCNLKRVTAACGERRRETLKFLKAIMIVAVLWCLLSKEGDSDHKRGNDRIREINPAARL
ncbi:MAG: hypothetical protein DME94_10025 [Verrucomicrobia bacterium]|nr:MAG: hypothetical protein DME94_10025 [Verrucomicrobiota bacterium]